MAHPFLLSWPKFAIHILPLDHHYSNSTSQHLVCQQSFFLIINIAGQLTAVQRSADILLVVAQVSIAFAPQLSFGYEGCRFGMHVVDLGSSV